MSGSLPLKCLGLLAPLFCWVERSDLARMAQNNHVGQTFQDLLRVWLGKELPTYSLDNLDDILAINTYSASVFNIPWRDRSLLVMDPPYDLGLVLEELAERYLNWGTGELTIREGMLDEYHVLLRRMPLSHLVHFFYARAVVRGNLDLERARQRNTVPETVPPGKQGIRKYVEKGLTETHVHLGGLLHGDDSWADNLAAAPSPLRNLQIPRGKRTVLFLGHISMRLLGWCLVITKNAQQPVSSAVNEHLETILQRMDDLYLESNPTAASFSARALELAYQQLVKMLFVRTDSHQYRHELKKAQDKEFKNILKAQKKRKEREAKNQALKKDELKDPAKPEEPENVRKEQNPDGLEDPSGPKEIKGDREEQGPDALEKELLGYLELDRVFKDQIFIDTELDSDPDRWPHRLVWLTEFEWLAPLLLSRRHDFHKFQHLDDRIKLLERFHFEIHYCLQTTANLSSHRQETSGPDQGNDPTMRSQNLTLVKQRFAETIHRLFYRYLIYQTNYWQSTSQAGRSTGLRTFKTFFDSKTRQHWRNRWEAKTVAFERLCNDDSLHAVEGRIGPPESVHELSNWMYLYGRNRYKLKRFGIIVHFIKSEEIKHSKGRFGIRHGLVRADVARQAKHLYNILTEPHPAVPFVVGIDAANLELTTPPEVFAPAFRFLRDFPISISNIFDRHHSYQNIHEYLRTYQTRQLGMTYHVGEDFRHILSGLRAIDEVIRFLRPNQDERLGHAIALAIDPELWFQQLGGQALIPKQEWLDSLVWAYGLLGAEHPLIRGLKIGDQIRKLSHEIYANRVANLHFQTQFRPFYRDDLPSLELIRREEMRRFLEDLSGRGTPWTVSELYDAWRLRQLDPLCPPIRQRLFKHKEVGRHSLNAVERRWWDIQIQLWQELERSLSSDSSYLLLKLYWFDPDVRDAGREVLTVDMHEDREAWIALCGECQKRMQTKVQKESLVIEANPSSNLLIGHYEKMSQHHIFNLTIDEKGQLKKKIPVTVNTDNPGVLHTSTSHEYYLLAMVLLERGIPKPKVIEWIEWLRTNGETYSMLHAIPTRGELERYGIIQQMEAHHRTPRHLDRNPCERFLNWHRNAQLDFIEDFTTQRNLRADVLKLRQELHNADAILRKHETEHEEEIMKLKVELLAIKNRLDENDKKSDE